MIFLKTGWPILVLTKDAMIEGEPFMYHAHIGFYLNIGLLLPMEIIKRAEFAFYETNAPLNAVGGLFARF